MVILSFLSCYLVLVILYKKENNSQKTDRKFIYTERLKQIQKTCQKYNLSKAEEENVRKSKIKILQTDTGDPDSFIAYPPLSDKV